MVKDFWVEDMYWNEVFHPCIDDCFNANLFHFYKTFIVIVKYQYLTCLYAY